METFPGGCLAFGSSMQLGNSHEAVQECKIGELSHIIFIFKMVLRGGVSDMYSF